MKKLFFTMLMIGATTSNISAQTNNWFQNVKFSGYGMVQYQGTDKKNSEENGFNLRLVRMALEGRAHKDF